MYIVKNAFGMIRAFSNLELAYEAYEEECEFCGFVTLSNAYTGEVIAEAW